MSDEVLVHISTPATRQNDELFRSLANAYIDFKPHRAQRDKPPAGTARINQSIQRSPKIQSPKGRNSADGRTANPTAPSASRETYGSFPSNVPAIEDHLDQDQSVRPVSRLAQLDQSYLNWRNRATPKSSHARGEIELRNSSDDFDADTGFIEDSQSALQALQSQLQNTYSTTSADTSEVDDDGGEISAEPHNQSVHTISVARSQECRISVKIPLSALSDEKAQNDVNSSVLHEPEISFGHAKPAPRNGLQSTADEVEFSKLSIDAFPPPPVMSVAHPEALPSQITQHLAAIKTQNPTRFKPIKIERDIESDERGFWRVDCTRWSPGAQLDFWLSLCEHVCSGRLGWATTLHREIGAPGKLGLVRLYCWGEVVEHMWLLLWLCSKGKASGMGSEWIDANSIAVIAMN